MAKKNYDAASDYLEKKYGKKTETSSQNASSDPASQYLQNKYGNKQSKKQEARQSFSDRYNAAQYDQRSSVDKNDNIQSRIYEASQRRADATAKRMQYYEQKRRDAKDYRSYQYANKGYDDSYQSWLQAYQNQQRTGANLLRNSMRMPEQELSSGQLPNTEPKRSDIERTIRERQRQEATAKQRKAAAEAALNQGYSYQGGVRSVDPAQYAQLQEQARAAAKEYEAAKRGTAEAEARLRAHDEQLEQRRIEEILSANRSDLERTARGARQMEAIAKDNLERARNAFGYGIDEGQSYADAQAKAEQEYAQAVKRSEQAADRLNLYDAFYRDARMNYVETQIKNDPGFRDKARTGRIKWEQEQSKAKAAARSADARTAMAQGALGGDVNPLTLWQAMRENADAAGVRGNLETTFSPDGLTEDQKDIFFALWAEDPQLAARWAEIATQKVDERYLKQIADWAGKNPGTRLLANVAGSNLSLASGLDPFGEAGQAANKLGQTLVSGGAQGLTEKGLLNTGFGAGTIQETTPVVGWLLKGKGLGDLYQLTSSMIQSGETALFAAMTGGLGAFAGTSLMGSAAAASDYAEQRERGVDQRTATVHATAAGVAEALFEYVSLDKLLDQDVTAAFLKNFLQQGGVEASEEICTSLANRISDGLILHANGYDNDIDRRRRELMAQGANYQDASARAEWDWIVDVLNDGLGGFLSGGMMTAGNYIPGAVAGLEQRALRNYLDRQMQKLGLSENDLADYMQTGDRKHVRDSKQKMLESGDSPILTSADQVRDFIRRALNGEVKDVIKGYGKVDQRMANDVAAQDPDLDISGYYLELDANHIAHIRDHVQNDSDARNIPLTPEQIEMLPAYLADYDDVLEVNKKKDGSVRVLFGKRINGHCVIVETVSKGRSALHTRTAWQNTTEEYMRKYKVDGRAAPEGASAVHDTMESGQGSGPSVDSVSQERNVVNTEYDDGLGVNGPGLGRVRGEDSSAAPQNDMRGNAVQDFGGQVARATAETGGMYNGTDSRTAGAEGLDDSAQRDAGLGAAEQAAGVEGRAGRQLAGGQTRESDARRKAAIAAYTAEPRSARDLGIRGGSSNAGLQLIEDQSIWTSDMQAAYEDARANGQEIRFVKGAIEVWNPQTKEYAAVNGIHQTNADGSVQYYIRADSRMRSAGQLYRHEVFHDLVDNNPQLWHQLAGYLKGNYTKAEVMRLLEAYVDAYNGIYGKDESSEMRYLEEAFADTYAEIQRGRADTRTVRETMQAFGDRIENARRNAQTSEASRETRGSPEQRYSMEMFNDESDSDKAKRLKNASVEIVQASPESLRAAANIDVSNSKAQDTASILFPILEEFGIFGNQYNQALEIEFDYSKTAGARSLSHQIEITGKNYTAQALVQTNLRELCEKAYPVEAHADEKASDPEAALKQIITLYSALQAGDDAVFAKMTIKIPQKESNRLHMVVTSEVKKGFDLALIAEATKPLSADKSNPRISIPAFLENVKNIGEFTKRIPVDLVLGESANYKDGLGVSGPGLGRQGESKDTTYLAAVEHGDMETAQRMVDEAARNAGYTIKVYHGTTQETISATKGRVPAGEYAALEKNYADKLFPFVVFKENGFHTGIYTATDRGVAEDFTFSFSHGGTIYDLYARSENPLVIDAQKRGWNNLPKSEAARVGLTEDVRQTLDSYKKTRTKGNVYMDDLVEFAKKNKYDAVIVENVRETGIGDETSPLTTDVVVFSSKQLKSADPVTYDDAGNVIPLSERFNPGKEDIRYSMAEEEDLGDGLGVNAPGLGRIGEEDSSAAPQNDMRESAEQDSGPAGGQARLVPTAQEGGRVARATEDGGQVARDTGFGTGNPSATGSGAGDSSATSTEDYHALAREKKEALAERASRVQLKGRIESAENRLKGMQESRKILQEMGLWNGETRSRLERDMANVRQTIEIDQAALSEKAKSERRSRDQQRETERKQMQPKIAKRDFRTDALNLFSIQAGSRQELGAVLDAFADRVIREGSISYEDRHALLQQLFERGIEVAPADAYYQEIRNQLRGGRIYVNEDVRAEFGDDWEDFRKRAWGSGIYLTNNSQDTGIDTWNQDLAESFPDSFDSQSTDLRQMLEAMVDLAEEGKAEHLTLEQMMQRNEQQYGVSVDEQMDELERKLDQLLDKFAEKANLEMETRRRGMMELVKERQAFRDMIAREAAKRLENQKRSEVMQQIRQINKMRRRSDNEVRAKIDEILGNLDTVARSISPQGIENLQALAQIYNQAKDDPNFLPNPYVEQRLARLGQVQLDDLKIEDVIELGRTISALVKSVQDQNRMLADARHQEISKAASQAYQEISQSKGSRDGKLAGWLKFEQVSPTRMIQQLGGWLRGGEMERLAKTLEDGGIRQLEYMRGATQFFDEFVKDKANRKWLQKASGKNADWIRVSVPVDYEGTETSTKVKMQEIEITPMMRVSLILHARNADNLRHIQTGGINIPDRKLYHKGDMANAYAKGTRIKMTPETVRGIISSATAQERAFANVLHRYFNEYSTPRINEVSMQIDGFERAGGENYFHIKTDPKFLSSLPATVQQNLSLESIGSIVNERVHAGNPIVLEDASQALTEHIDTISKYYGYTAAIRDFNAVMSYTFHEVGNAFDGSIKEALAQKWGADAQKYLDRLMADLQQKSSINETAAKLLSKLRGNLAGATLMLNPAVAMSQAASYPGAMQTLGLDGLLYGLRVWDRADMGLIQTYSPVLWYRNQGNSTQELGDYMSEQGLEQKLPFLLNWIQKVDSATIKRLWVAAEYRVKHDTGMKPGSAQEIEAGTDPFYQKVAEVFNRAVLDTQPNYTTMQRPQILRSASDMTKFLTMYKTVPLQYYNMMYEAVGRLQADQARAKADPESRQAQEDLKQSQSFAAKTFTGILSANVIYVVMKAAVKALTGRAKKYEDEEGNLFTEAMWKQLGLDLLETTVGSFIGGTELLQVVESAIASTAGKKLTYYGTEISAISFLDDLGQNVIDLAGAIGSMNLKDGLDAIRQTALNLATGMGIPAKNAETYLKGLMRWIAPEWVARYDNFFDEVEKNDLSGKYGQELNMAVQMLMENRAEEIGDDVIGELDRLYAAGHKNALPSAVPGHVTVDKEEIPLDAEQKELWRKTWGEIVSEELADLLASDRYLQADDEGKAKLVAKLYAYAAAAASAAAVEGYEPDNWVQQGQALRELGVSTVDYLDFYLSQQELSSAKERMDALNEVGWTEEQKEAYWLGNMASDKQAEKYGYLKENGTGWTEAMDLLNIGETDSTKLTEAQQARYDEVWNQTVEDAIKQLYANSAYKNADADLKTAYLDKLYEFAAQVASAEVKEGYACDRWVKAGQDALKQGVSLADYIVFAAGFNKVDGKNNKGETVNGLQNYRQIELLRKTGWTEKQMKAVYFDMIAEGSAAEKAQAMLNAGLSMKQVFDVMGVYGNRQDWNRAVKIIESGAPEAAKVKALGLYISGDKYIAVQAGYRFGVNMNNWVNGWNTADTDSSGGLSQKEVTAYIDSLQGLSTQEKAYLWQMLTTSSGWKKNPYSQGMGKEIKDWMLAEQENAKSKEGG